MRKRAPLIIFVLLLSCASVATQEIDNFNVLFPTAYHSTDGYARQLITTQGGCYQWQSKSPQIISVIGVSPDHNNCNPYGIVQLKHQGKYQGSIHVSLKNQNTQQSINIPVRIKDLEKISIFTKSKTMNIKQTQNLQVYGFDLDHNTFTSLEGLTFKWQIVNIDGEITKIPLNEASLYMIMDTRKKLELRGLQSDYLIVKALKVGKIKIQVRCLEKQYSHIQDQITIFVQQKFEIYPSLPLSILSGSSYQLYLKNPSGKNITLPAPQYLITVDNGFIITDQMLVTAPSYRSESIVNVSDRRTIPAFYSTLNIISLQPDRFQIICPQQIIIGKSIQYRIQFYKNNELLKGTPTRLSVYAPDGFHINQEQKTISSIFKTTGQLLAQYNGLTVKKTIHSSTPVNVILPTKGQVVLPAGQVYQLKTIGGSGLYRYEIDRRQLAKIGYNGLITAKSQGQTIIKVFDQKNPNNFININLIISGISKIGNLQQRKQSNINQLSSLFISASPRTKKQAYFTECNDAIKKIFLKSSGSTGIFQIISVYGASLQTLSELKNEANTNKMLKQSLEKQTVIPISKQDIIKQFNLHIQNGDISRNQLNQIIQEMENYKICSKVIYKGLASYNDITNIVAGDSEPIKVHMRVYPDLNTIFKLPSKDPYQWVTNQKNLLNNKQITMTPLSSFKWELEGGSYSWDSPTQIYLNGLQMNNNGRQKYPIITCPDSNERSVNKYLLQLKNPMTQSLLRPVTQQSELTVICQLPSRIKTTILSQLPKPQDSSLSKYIYRPNKQFASAIYLTPNQKFHILVEPLTKFGIPFYNSSNVFYDIISLTNSKIARMQTVHKGYNYRFFQYINRQNSVDSHQDNEVQIKILSADLVRYSQQQLKQVGQQIKERFIIKTLSQLKITLQEEQSGGLIMPDHPSATRTISVPQRNRPYQIKCQDQSLVTAWRDLQGNIKIHAKGNPGRTVIQVVDQLILGQPSISLPIRVFQPSGIDLSISSTDDKKRESATKKKLWVIEGQQVILGLQVYSKDGSDRMIIKDINKDDISISFDSQPMNSPDIREIQRYFDKQSQQIIIRYSTSTSKIGDKQNKNGLSYTMRAKLTKYPMVSNDVNLKVFKTIGIRGGQSLLSKNPDGMDFQIYIINSCKKDIQIYGGPPDLTTMVISNIGQNYHHQITKISENKYQIQALKALQQQDNSIDSINIKQITGNQNNLIIIAIRYDGYELGNARFLVNVEEIGNFGISGLSKLIKGKQTRLLAEADNIGMINAVSCQFKFTWKSSNKALSIMSDPFRNGINITGLQKGDSTVQIVVSNQKNKFLGRAQKKISIVQQFQYDPIIKSEDNLILMPPNSAVEFPDHIRLQEVSPCDQQDSQIIIQASNKLRSGSQTSNQAQVIKISSYSDPNEVPSYFNAIVTKICAIYIQNEYGALNVHRDIPVDFNYYMTDCFGRRFIHKPLNIQLKVNIADRDIASYQINSALNIIRVTGHKIGTTMLSLQIGNQEYSIKDVVPLIVNIFIEPSKQVNVHVGDQINFRAATSKHESQWQSSNKNGLSIDKSTGVAQAKIDGQYSVKFGNMETKVLVTRLTDIIKTNKPFIYIPVYSNLKELSSHSSIVRNMKWQCSVVGSQSRYFTAQARINKNPQGSSEEVSCQIQRTTAPPPQKFSNIIEIKVTARVKSKFQFYKNFVEHLNAEDFFIITTDRHIEPKQHTGLYYVIIESKQRLQVYQRGGNDEWIQKTQYNGAKQVITLDFTTKESRAVPWQLHLFNPKTSQREIIQIGRGLKIQNSPNEDSDSGQWKWTDILVVIMGANFIALCLYQVFFSNQQGNNHYHTY